MTAIIDTHIHVWDLSRADYPWLKGDTSVLNRTWQIEEIEEERLKANVVSGVLVQAAGNAEDTEVMLETARRTSWISGVVIWLPLINTDATQKLLEEKFLKEKYFKGVRHQVHDEKDTKWLLQPAVIESLKLLADHTIPYDAVGTLPAHLETALRVAEMLPELQIVLDHLNWPPITTKEKFGKWGDLIRQAAQLKNVHAKISGLGTASGNFENRTAEDIKPYVEFVLNHFSPGRCFCGGDWPVSTLANGYAQTWMITKQILGDILPEKEKNDVLYFNAEKFYHLQLSNTGTCK